MWVDTWKAPRCLEIPKIMANRTENCFLINKSKVGFLISFNLVVIWATRCFSIILQINKLKNNEYASTPYPFSSFPAPIFFFSCFSDVFLWSHFKNHNLTTRKTKTKLNKNTWIPSKIFILQKALKVEYHWIVCYC